VLTGGIMAEEKKQTEDNVYVLVNIVEELVRTKVREAITKAEMCQCSLCENNICAITLNELAPRYVTTQKGHLLAQIALMNPDYLFNVNLEIAKAMKTVKEKPRH
jgi:competence protein ComFB